MTRFATKKFGPLNAIEDAIGLDMDILKTHYVVESSPTRPSAGGKDFL